MTKPKNLRDKLQTIPPVRLPIKKGLSKKQLGKLSRSAPMPFLLLDTDPRPGKLGMDKLPESNRLSHRKVLTNLSPARILKPVKKLKKGRQMAKTKKSKNVTRGSSSYWPPLKAVAGNRSALLSGAWLVEAAFRIFIGWTLLSNFDHYLTTAAALYALGTAAVIVVVHFIKANK